MRSREDDNELLAFYNYMKVVCFNIAGNTQDAEDLLHNVYLKAFTHTMKHRDNIKSYLVKIAKNEYINDYRRKKLESEIIKSEADPDRVAYQDHTIDVEKIMARIAMLPDSNCQVIKMRMQGYKYKEIAEATHFEIGTIKCKISLARDFIGRNQM